MMGFACSHRKMNFLIVFLSFSFFLSCCSFSEAQKVPAMYVFGDSLVDVGNNDHIDSIIRADFPHNGVDYPGRKATGRFSNGNNSADFIAEKVGLPTPPPYLSDKNNVFLKGVSFASGGAGILNSTNNGVISKALHLSDQVRLFSTVQQKLVNQLGAAAAKQQLSKSPFLILIGSNDLINYFNSDSKHPKTTPPQQFVDQMIATLKPYLQQLHGLGARKFVIPAVPAIGCMPLLRHQHPNKTGECLDGANYWANKYNQGLQSMLQSLKSSLNDFNYSYFDTYNYLLTIIQNPSTYGFKEVKAACCGLGRLNAEIPCTPISIYCSNRSDYIFWDRYHPTEAAASVLASAVFSGSKQYANPVNLNQLISL
ncbi:GDSL esterase/lipase At5g55050 [Ipomoea triloba]|uniref:GDSL esterase/lipase At5g55050 n=1 Tax=Ipomoea triloba TaxID=35885 RepID=UPI00125DB334|nr:GDSL esterase/lipase At5g55050 [Ipomoea triloba]